jgi:hypothetical protein
MIEHGLRGRLELLGRDGPGRGGAKGGGPLPEATVGAVALGDTVGTNEFSQRQVPGGLIGNGLHGGGKIDFLAHFDSPKITAVIGCENRRKRAPSTSKNR